jgi:molybdate transport system substrate-binding protein
MFSTSSVLNMSVRLSSFLVTFFVLCLPFARAQTTLTIAAAADLSSVEPFLQEQFEKTNPIRLRFVTGASASLAQQIENGAPYDIFLSANAQFVDRLAREGNIEPGSVWAYAVGRLGLLWGDRKQHDFKDLALSWVGFVALPNPQLAPYGVAAREALEHAGIWQAVQHKIVYGENVRQTLQLFESGNADAVLTSESLLEGKHAQLVPANWHNPILQKAGIIANTAHRRAAQKFMDFLHTPAAKATFSSFGFSPVS